MILDKLGFDVAIRKSNGDTLLHRWTSGKLKKASELLNDKEILDKFRENGIDPFGAKNVYQMTVLHNITCVCHISEQANSILKQCSKEEINA